MQCFPVAKGGTELNSREHAFNPQAVHTHPETQPLLYSQTIFIFLTHAFLSFGLLACDIPMSLIIALPFIYIGAMFLYER